jgi:hypothetical protein
MPSKPALTLPARRTKDESLRKRLERLAKKSRPSLTEFLKTVPPGTRTKEDIDREFEELRGVARG